jgi:hypothetical protein
MEKLENQNILDTESVRRNEKLRSAGEIIKDLFESVEDNAIKKIMENPTYENLGGRQ